MNSQLSLRISALIVAFGCFTSGCKSKSIEQLENKNSVVYTYEEDEDEICNVDPFGKNSSLGMNQVKRWKIDTSEDALAALEVPVSVLDPTDNFINGYKDGWKERSNNYYFFQCEHDKEILSAYTPMMRDIRNEPVNYRKGWELGWKKGTENAELYLEQLQYEVHKN